jgi:hypothetical protein
VTRLLFDTIVFSVLPIRRSQIGATAGVRKHAKGMILCRPYPSPCRLIPPWEKLAEPSGQLGGEMVSRRSIQAL